MIWTVQICIFSFVIYQIKKYDEALSKSSQRGSEKCLRWESMTNKDTIAAFYLHCIWNNLLPQCNWETKDIPFSPNGAWKSGHSLTYQSLDDASSWELGQIRKNNVILRMLSKLQCFWIKKFSLLSDGLWSFPKWNGAYHFPQMEHENLGTAWHTRA